MGIEIISLLQLPGEITSPVIAYDGNLSGGLADFINLEVMSEGLLICTTPRVKDAIGILMACYYVFNMVYPKELSKTLLFIQRVILNLHDSSKVPHKILAVVKRLNCSALDLDVNE